MFLHAITIGRKRSSSVNVISYSVYFGTKKNAIYILFSKGITRCKNTREKETFDQAKATSQLKNDE